MNKFTVAIIILLIGAVVALGVFKVTHPNQEPRAKKTDTSPTMYAATPIRQLWS